MDVTAPEELVQHDTGSVPVCLQPAFPEYALSKEPIDLWGVFQIVWGGGFSANAQKMHTTTLSCA